MLATALSATVWGVDAFQVQVEVHWGSGTQATVVVGLPDTAVKESRERVNAAIQSNGYKFPYGRITINIAPADLRKEGPSFDLPIALCTLAASSQLKPETLRGWWMVGELALTGEVRPIKGMLSVALAAQKAQQKRLLVPRANAKEAAMVRGLEIYPVDNLRQAAEFLEGRVTLNPVLVNVEELFQCCEPLEIDFCEVKGQEHVKRALEIAVAGNHNLLMIGPPGSGKSMLAKRLPTIFPPLTIEESLETTRIHSVAGLLPAGQALVTQRVFRNPHHTISDVGLIGGGVKNIENNKSPIKITKEGVIRHSCLGYNNKKESLNLGIYTKQLMDIVGKCRFGFKNYRRIFVFVFGRAPYPEEMIPNAPARH